MAKNIKQIKEAVLANRGGLQNADDRQIMMLWQSLDDKTQKQYIESINERKKKDAVGDKPKSDI